MWTREIAQKIRELGSASLMGWLISGAHMVDGEN